MKRVYQVNEHEMNQLIVHFACSIMNIYSKDVRCNGKMSVVDFKNENELLVKLVYSKTKKILGYDLTYDQMCDSIRLFMHYRLHPQSVLNREEYADILLNIFKQNTED